MQIVLDVLGWLLMLTGGGLVVVGAIGMLRFPDMYTRMHAASVTETLGLGLLLTGMLIHATTWLVAIKLVLLGILLFVTNPTSSHALAKAALHGGLKPRLDSGEGNSGRDRSSKP
ncbi:MAG: monovalent cation/H(+) antiporter subunit G [Pseudomonadota bacterium]